MGNIRGCLGPTYDFQIDTTYMKTVKKLWALKYSIVIQHKNTKFDHSHLNIILWLNDKRFG